MKTFFMCAGIACLTATVSPARAADDDLAKLTGSWKAVSIEEGGKQLPQERVEKVTLKVDGPKYTIKIGDVVIEGTHQLAPTKRPKQIDAVRTKGPGQGKTVLGIYELDADTYKACFGAPGMDRPNEFATTAGSEQRLYVFKKQK